MSALALALLLLGRQGLDIATLSQMAANRDVAGLTSQLLGSGGSISPFAVLSGGAYDTGRFGWKALEMTDLTGKDLVVFTTPITSEDTGELVFQRVGSKLKYIPEADDLGILVRRHHFQLWFQPEEKKARLVDRVEFRRHGTAGKSFLVRFSPQYKVQSVLDGDRKVDFVQTGGVVSLPAPAGSGDFTYTMTYGATVDLPDFAGSVSTKEATLTNDYWYPMIARQPAPYDIAIHAPANWTAVAQGELVSTEKGAKETVTTYRMDLPVTYYSVSAAPYNVFQESIHGRRYSVWSLHMSQEQMEEQCELYAPIIEFYDRSFAKFPFSGYGAVVSDVYGGGALEAYSFATYGGPPGEDAHEPSHTWWGGMVDNSYLKSFWNESFADYCDDLYHQEAPIGNVQQRRLAFVDIAGDTPEWDRGTMEDSGVAYGGIGSALGYGKGAHVLAMLQQQIGREAMLKSMQTWIADHPTDRSGEWEDFETAVAKATGRDLKWFWDEWARRPGVPEFEISDVRYADGRVLGRVKFTGAPYRMNVEALAQAADGSREYHTFTLGGDGVFSFECSQKPALVSIDPWRRLLRKVRRDEWPVSIGSFRRQTVFRDPAQPAFRPDYPSTVAAWPSDLDHAVIVGSPETLPAMKPLCAEAGFTVSGSTLTYKGTTVDLRHGTASAVVDLGGKQCLILLGTSKRRPNSGLARICLADDLGRFLDGETDPKTSGNLTFRIN